MEAEQGPEVRDKPALMRARHRYLVPGEEILYTTRRHTVVLGNATSVLVVALVAGAALALLSSRRPAYHLALIGGVVALAGVLYFGYHALEWWVTRYVITNERILFMGGLVARRVNALPLRLVIDTTYRRTILGKLMGYCDLDVNLSGQPGLRHLTTIPHGERVYHLILRLLTRREVPAPATPAAPASGAPAPAPAAPVTPPTKVEDTVTGPIVHRLPPNLRGG